MSAARAARAPLADCLVGHRPRQFALSRERQLGLGRPNGHRALHQGSQYAEQRARLLSPDKSPAAAVSCARTIGASGKAWIRLSNAQSLMWFRRGLAGQMLAPL